MSNELMDMMEQDFQEVIASSTEKMGGGELSVVSVLARRMSAAEKEISDLEETLKQMKRDYQKLTDEELPAALEELGITQMKLEDGSVIEVKPLYGAHISEANKAAAFDWLREHGYDDIIKNVVTCRFGRGEDDQAQDFLDMAEQKGLFPEQKTDVHAQTLKAFVRERVENGDPLPMDLFGAFVSQRAVIKKGKK